jgi:hypothetical protein
MVLYRCREINGHPFPGGHFFDGLKGLSNISINNKPIFLSQPVAYKKAPQLWGNRLWGSVKGYS